MWVRFLNENHQNSKNFKPWYINKNFENIELLWHAVDLEYPAEIMPVAEYKEHIKTLKNISVLVP